MRRTRASAMLLVVLAVLTARVVAPGRAEAQPAVIRAVSVNCAAGQTIAGALRRQVLGQGLLVRISGTCNEHVDIFRDDVILRGVAVGATINGPTTTEPTVMVDNARRVSLESLMITGGRDGVVGRGSSVTLDNITVQGAARFGVVASFGAQLFVDGGAIRQCGSLGALAANGSTLVLTNITVEGNGGGGIQATRNSHLRVGQDAEGSATLGEVLIQGNIGTGIIVNESSAAIVVATTILAHTSNGMYVARGSHADVGIGSFGVVGANTILNNGAGSSGILVEGASAAIVGNTITGNGHGVQFLNGGTGRLGIRPDSTAYLGNTIVRNLLHGILLNSGATAVIGGNNVSANGFAGTVGNRTGIFVSQSSANLIGQNTIADHPETGIFVRQGSLFVGNSFAALSTAGNVIRNNACAANASTRSGVFLFDGATSEIRNTTVTQNCGPNITATINSVLNLVGGTVSLAQQVDGVTTFAPGIQIGTRSTLRPGTGSLIDANQGDGIFISNGGTLEIRNDSPTTISNNTGVSINCAAGQTQNTILIPGPTIFSGNGTDAVSANCVQY